MESFGALGVEAIRRSKLSDGGLVVLSRVHFRMEYEVENSSHCSKDGGVRSAMTQVRMCWQSPKSTIDLRGTSFHAFGCPRYRMVLEDALMELVKDIRGDALEDIAVRFFSSCSLSNDALNVIGIPHG
ncbi:hypothetical protein A0H81_10477 [Grifola frondosa]|uniref:Uncharacterized protein n=1 Tax=Grifola frondosa TaxID=5627 RepID=A0A1C7LZ41_GRIFR|nr:hypothetical protein A0H81_10477 [Grifola frondosa]